MRVELIAFTARGNALAERLAAELTGAGCPAACTREGLRVEEWAARAFGRSEALVFVGAAGIAVRAIAPCLRHKSTDPAVVVVDEAGRYAVPILSGHLGGANDLARRIAGLTGAEAVLTTATDVNGVFAADQWARRQGLLVPWPERILGVSSRLLAGETVPFWSRCPVSGPCPAGLIWGERDRADIVVDWTPPRPEALWLCPRTLRVGVGCRRGTSEEAIRALFDRTLDGLGLPARAVGAVCSIDLKAEEPGLLAFAGALGMPLTVYSAGRLARVEGSVSPSSFVAQVTGVDNVCERAALAEGGVLLKSKTALDGVTLALAGTEPNLDWRERV